MPTDQDALTKALQEEVRTLTEALEEKDRALQEAQDRSLRALAEFQNYKKRAEEDRREFREFAVADLLTKLLPFVDQFDQSLRGLDAMVGQLDGVMAASGQKTHPGRMVSEGIRLVHREFWSVLEKEGLKVQTVLHQRFDPHHHEAVAQVETAEVADGTIVEEFRRGYELKGKVLRPAMVKVAVPPKEKSARDETDEKDERDEKNLTDKSL